MNLTEKYRPENFDDLVGQQEIAEKLENSTLEDLQHLLFVGDAGIGKTTTAHILKEKFFDEGTQNRNFKEMNASTENSIDNIRNEVRNFVKTAPVQAEKNILFLDEADNISKDGQQALRRMMEKNSDNCVFILSGNYVDDFIQPIKSRCMVMEFNGISSEEIKERLCEICEQENVEYVDETIQNIAEDSGGDLRSAINTLWFSIRDGEVEDVTTEKDDISELSRAIATKRYLTAKGEMEDLLDKGMEAQKLVKYLYEFAEASDLNNRVKVIWYEELADADYRMSRDTVKRIQLNKAIYNICSRMREVEE